MSVAMEGFRRRRRVLASDRQNALRLTTMSHVVTPLDQPSNYKDSQARVDRYTQNELLNKSSTLYVSLHLQLRTWR